MDDGHQAVTVAHHSYSGELKRKQMMKGRTKKTVANLVLTMNVSVIIEPGHSIY